MKPLKVAPNEDMSPTSFTAINGNQNGSVADGHTAGYIPNSVPVKDTDWILEETSEDDVTTGGDVTWDGIKKTAIGCCTLSKWRSRLPISIWLPKYSLLDFKGDMVAGLTVGLTVVPQGLAYAAIAQVPLEYGLYSAFMGCFMYTLLGTAKDITLGPTAVLSLMTAAAFPKDASPDDKAHYAVILSFFSGICQLFLGIFNLGFLINFISAPVISGFTTTSAFIILYGQIKTLTGIQYVPKIWTPSGYKSSPESVWEITQGYVMSIRSINGWDTLMGMICLTILLLMKEMSLPRRPRFGVSKRTWNILREVVRTICVTRYALVIIVATGISYYVTEVRKFKGLSITSEVKGGIPKFGPPDFSWGNHTASESIATMLPSIPMIVLVGALESIAVAKAFAFQFQYRIEPTQELFALGLSNLLCSFFHAYPVTGSFTRSALKAQSGVRTPLGCTWTGAFVLLAMSVISPAFKYVPKSALSAVIIAAILILFEFKIFYDLWLISKRELLAIFTVVIIGFTFSVDYGILAGIGVSMLLLLYPIARPVIIAHFKESLYSLRPRNPTTGKRAIHVNVTPQGAIYFPAAEYLKDFFHDEIVAKEYNEVSIVPKDSAVGLLLEIAEIKEEIVFDGTHLNDSDYTTLRALRSVVMNCKRWNKKISFVNTPAEILRIVLPKDMRQNTHVKAEDGSIKNMDVSTIVLSESTAERVASSSQQVLKSMEPSDSAHSMSHFSQEELLDEDEVEKLDYEQNLPKPSPTLSSHWRRGSSRRK